MTAVVVVLAMTLTPPTTAQAVSTVVSISPQINPLTGISAEGDVNGISCVAVHSCVAVGSDVSEPIVLIGDPTTWNVHDVRQITLGNAFSSVGDFWSVSCVTETYCVAVGNDSANSMKGSEQPIVAVGNPATWTAANVRQVALGSRFGGGGTLNSVSCVSTSFCVAVGSDGADDDNTGAIVLSGNPGSWKQGNVRQVVNPSSFFTGGSSELLGVTCTTMSMCVAVGDDNAEPLVFSGSPRTWGPHRARIVVDNSPNYWGGSLTAVTCVSENQCVAVGSESVGYWQSLEPLVVSGNPSTWSARDYRVMVLGPHFGDYGQLAAVSCTSINWCDAVGTSNVTTSQPIDVEGNPSSWDTSRVRQLPVPRALGSGASLSAVVCSSLTCTALGEDNEYRGDQIIQITGEPSQWRIDRRDAIRLSGSAYGANADIVSMSCPTRTQCVGVGVDSNLDGVVMLGDPTQWANATAIELPQATDLSSVSCTSPAYCVAVGSGDGFESFVLTGDPDAWTARSGHVLSLGRQFGDWGNGLSGVSCVAATFCVAVGWDSNVITRSGEGQPIEVSGNPASWTGTHVRQFVMSAHEGKGGTLDSIDCTSRRWCVAVGGDEAGQILVQQGNPQNWSASSIAQVVVPGSLGSSGFLNSVTCVSPASCVAVGASGRPLVMRGNPRTWGSSQMTGVYVVPPLHNMVHANPSSPVPAVFGEPGFGYFSSEFVSVSCLSDSSCAAAGIDESGAPMILSGAPASWRLAAALRLSTSVFDSANLDAAVCVATSCYLVGSSPEGPFVAPV